MHYKIFSFLFFVLLSSCVSKPLIEESSTSSKTSFFINKGFALVYSENLNKKKIIGGKIDNRSLILFQKNLKKNTPVKITNLMNSKYLIAKVGKKSNYPFFYNSVISKRIKDELQIDESEPYIEIKEIIIGDSFIAKKAKTYEEEKNVADKAPVEDIQIKNLGNNNKKDTTPKKSRDFNYIIKIADFYFEDSAKQLKLRILNETSIKIVEINKLSSTNFRVFIGPFSDLNSLKNSFNAINVLEFESIEIIKK
tara:strand:- start:682 stop:1437 length:756 start_codon:yes stop_codon:yes gene_type:complete